jgi:crotonobetainyl-CoA:carnitine CoA-transferase CaiB-like acyl-CoA transferase
VVVDDRDPQFLGPALADAITGIYASYGILGALVQRGRTGEGTLVEISMLEAMTHFAVEPFAAYFALGTVPRSADRPRLAQAYILRTADARLIVLHLSSLEKFWTGLVAALEEPQLARDPRFLTRQARIDNYEALRSELMTRFGAKDLTYWAERLRRHDVPHAPINGVDEVVADPQVAHLGLIVPVETAHGGERAVRPPVRFAGERAASVQAAPLLDEHGAQIREALQAATGWPDRR